jgi:small conductance mechanosensitive channel
MLLATVPAWLVPDPEHLGTILVRLGLTVFVAWLLQRFGFLLVRRAERWLVSAAQDHPATRQRARTLGQTTRHLITTAVAAGALLHGLDVIGWDVKPLLVGASIIGAALGFGAQSLVRDVISGAAILIENQYSVGDAVEVAGTVATVEDVTLRSTRLRDYQGRLLFVPNGEMRIVINHSRDWHRTLVDVPLAPNQDLSRALEAAGAAVAALGADPGRQAQLLEPAQVIGLERAGADGVLLRLAVRTAPGAAAANTSRELRRMTLDLLFRAGVRVASPDFTPPSAPDAGAGAPAERA